VIDVVVADFANSAFQRRYIVDLGTIGCLQ